MGIIPKAGIVNKTLIQLPINGSSGEFLKTKRMNNIAENDNMPRTPQGIPKKGSVLKSTLEITSPQLNTLNAEQPEVPPTSCNFS